MAWQFRCRRTVKEYAWCRHLYEDIVEVILDKCQIFLDRDLKRFDARGAIDSRNRE